MRKLLCHARVLWWQWGVPLVLSVFAWAFWTTAWSFADPDDSTFFVFTDSFMLVVGFIAAAYFLGRFLTPLADKASEDLGRAEWDAS